MDLVKERKLEERKARREKMRVAKNNWNGGENDQKLGFSFAFWSFETN